jgi:hypothetical protein
MLRVHQAYNLRFMRWDATRRRMLDVHECESGRSFSGFPGHICDLLSTTPPMSGE